MHRNLIVNFPPGARGFLLSKWLYKNNLVNFYDFQFPIEFNFDSENHNFVPFYNDVLFYFTTDSKKQTFESIERELVSVSPDVDAIKRYLNTSKFQQPQIKIHLKNPYNLILSHHHSVAGIQVLAKCLSATVLRVKLDNTQIHECYHRKFKEPGTSDFLKQYYMPFMQEIPNGISVELKQIECLDLESLKDALC